MKIIFLFAANKDPTLTVCVSRASNCQFAGCGPSLPLWVCPASGGACLPPGSTDSSSSSTTTSTQSSSSTTQSSSLSSSSSRTTRTTTTVIPKSSLPFPAQETINISTGIPSPVAAAPQQDMALFGFPIWVLAALLMIALVSVVSLSAIYRNFLERKPKGDYPIAPYDMYFDPSLPPPPATIIGALPTLERNKKAAMSTLERSRGKLVRGPNEQVTEQMDLSELRVDPKYTSGDRRERSGGRRSSFQGPVGLSPRAIHQSHIHPVPAYPYHPDGMAGIPPKPVGFHNPTGHGQHPVYPAYPLPPNVQYHQGPHPELAMTFQRVPMAGPPMMEASFRPPVHHAPIPGGPAPAQPPNQVHPPMHNPPSNPVIPAPVQPPNQVHLPIHNPPPSPVAPAPVQPPLQKKPTKDAGLEIQVHNLPNVPSRQSPALQTDVAAKSDPGSPQASASSPKSSVSSPPPLPPRSASSLKHSDILLPTSDLDHSPPPTPPKDSQYKLKYVPPPKPASGSSDSSQTSNSSAVVDRKAFLQSVGLGNTP
ncbi:hypothetical protein HDV03_000312 [Kappamyces sp. JEL0829]|nr:hypothetical protein HDV03_000312 [Kappamyces sp. JEL0829]